MPKRKRKKKHFKQCTKEGFEKFQTVEDIFKRCTQSKQSIAYSDCLDICDARGEEMHNESLCLAKKGRVRM